MLHHADLVAPQYSGVGTMWQQPYAIPQPHAAAATASVWFTAYAPSTMTRPNESVLAALGDAELWRLFHEIGIDGIHTGPTKRAGAIRGREYTPTIDGYFDRIESSIDPAFGTENDYRRMVDNARARGAIVIGDLIPGHSGKGADFRLAERRYRDYPGLYHMVEIRDADLPLLPPVAPGKDSVNLEPDVVDELERRGYIVGRLERTIFRETGVKETDWSVTDTVVGVDGKKRRWVYLHYFKEGEPTYNWLDPTFAAPRLVIGDALHSLGVLGDRMLRLDANGFLGVEIGPAGARAWSEGHPLSLTANQLIAGLVRKVGGFTFQELNLTLDDIKAMSVGGADLSYDFVTRPAYQHALATGRTDFLRLMLRLQHDYDIDPAGLVHGLQNHDELTLELVHFWRRHEDTMFEFRRETMKGKRLREIIRDEMHAALVGTAAPYNMIAPNGIACTTVSLAAASLGITVERWADLSDAQKRDIQRAHILLATFSAMQPGVFALSGWDLVGAATLPPASVKAMLADGDTRWINRGAYDLLGIASPAAASPAGLPRAYAIYGSLPDQLLSPVSFASELKRLLVVRAKYRISESKQVAIPTVRAPGLLVMVHRLPAGKGLEITALNFGRRSVSEAVVIDAARVGAKVTDLLVQRSTGTLVGKRLALELGPHEAKILLLE